MKPYSSDLRERVIATVEAMRTSQAKIAETFHVCLSTVEKWWGWRFVNNKILQSIKNVQERLGRN
jgi:transposase